MLETPVAFFVFNRPDTTRRVFAEIAKAKPKKLLVVADGPRPDCPGEDELCAEVRAIVDRIDWDCEVLKNYSTTNLGCKYRVSSGLDWVFDQCEEAIILEDDCLPDPSFFEYCHILLREYRDSDRINVISGTNLINTTIITEYSVYYSQYFHIWGWASWRKAWKYYDVNIEDWPIIKQTKYLGSLSNIKPVKEYWESVFDQVYRKDIDTWDYQWFLTCWRNNWLGVTPKYNLITNIGFDQNATHTKTLVPSMANIKLIKMHFPMKLADQVATSIEIDKAILKSICPWAFYSNNILTRIKNRIF